MFGFRERVTRSIEFGPLAIHPIGGCCWAARKKPQWLRANYHKHCGVLDDTIFEHAGLIWRRPAVGGRPGKEGIDNSLAAIRSCRQARPDGAMIYVVLDNLSAHKDKKIKAWCAKYKRRVVLHGSGWWAASRPFVQS